MMILKVRFFGTPCIYKILFHRNTSRKKKPVKDVVKKVKEGGHNLFYQSDISFHIEKKGKYLQDLLEIVKGAVARRVPFQP